MEVYEDADFLPKINTKIHEKSEMIFKSYKRPYTVETLPPLPTTANSLIARGRGSLGYNLTAVSTSHRYRYVASSTRRGKGLDMDAMERKKREREVSFRYRNVNSIDRTTTDWSGGSNRSFKARLTRVLTNRNTTTQQPYGTHFTPTTAKQIYFVLNGRPSHIYRCLLNPARPLDLETILEEVSQGLGVAIFKIYTYDGERITGMDQLLELKDNRVLAVPRHERLMLQGRAYADAEQFQSSTTGLPPIRRFRESSRSSSGNIPYSTRRYHAQTQGNSIEKPRRPYLPPTAATLPQQTTRQRYVSSLVAGKQKSTVDEVPTISNEAASSSSIPRKESQSRAANFPQLQNAEPTTTTVTTSKSTAQWKAKRGLTNSKDVINKRANAKTWNQTTTTIAATVASGGAVLVGNTLQSSTNTADSDSGRPRSSNDFSNGHTTAVPLDEFDEEDAIEDDDEDPDSEVEGDDEMEAANHEFEDDDDYPEQPYGIAEEAVEQDVERSEANLLALREEREDRELSMIKPGSASDNEAIKRSALNATAAVVLQNIAATKIQARARGFLVRRRAQRQQEEPVEQTIPVEPPETTTNQNEAAAKIQAGVRGFLTRQRLKREFESPPTVDCSLGRVSDNELTRVKEEEQQERASAPSRTSDRQSIKESRPVSVTSKRSERDIEDELNSEENKKDDLESTLIEQTDDVDEIVRELAEEQQIDRIEDAAELAPESEVLKDEVEAEGPTEIAAQLQAELPVNLNDAESTVHGGESEVDDAISENKLTTAPKLVTNDTDADHDVCSGSDEDEDDVLAKRTQGPEKVDSYSVTVKLGNRWAADSETELYITMIGERKESEKFYMRHKYVNWLESEQTNYVQQSSDTFQMQVECGFLGIIRKLIVGHDTVGYGAGIFIDRIIITEDAVNGRAFLFQCLKWFDSGQVDGKLERTLRLSAYYDMDPIPHAMQRVTCGRWEVVLHNGDSKGVGGTTSNLRLVGFGTRGSDTVELANEKELREVPSKTLMQCHFNGIGELLKLRVEIDGSGDEPDYFLEQVELRDLDTQDRCVLPCSRWLKWSSTKKGEQPFREFLTFRLGTEPLPLITYDGKLRITPPKFECVEPKVRLELVGDMGESGFIWIDLNDAVEKNGKLDLSFKVEAVSIGKLNIARLFLQPNEIGEQIYEGFAVLQDVWDARNDETTRLTPLGTTGNDWLVGFLYVREGAHTPYRYVLNSSIIRPRSGPEDPYVKELRRSALEGTSTRVSKKKALEYRTPTWLLSMSLTAESKLLPLVYLCGMKDTAQMDVISATPTDNLLSFRLKEADLGDLCKVRVKADKRAILGEQNIRSVDEQKQSAASNPKAPTFHIKKVGNETEIRINTSDQMRLSDSVNGDEIRFPSADVEMEDGEVVEFPAFWPDRPPLPNLVYEVRVSTGASNLESNAPIRLNIFGEFGDISYRKLDSVVNKPEKPIFSADSKCTFEFEAVSIGVPTTAEITVECEQNEFLWECTELVLTGSLSGQSYVFNFSR
ncbi:Doublecortin family protein [Aphelenchoides besseyi]|nr:Doublecortin family protein [Aphelenchoides besseyi]